MSQQNDPGIPEFAKALLGEETTAASDPGGAFDRATWHFDRKEYAPAATLFADLAQADPENLEVRLYLARAYYHSAQLGRAERVLISLVDSWPTEAYAHYLLARTLQRAGRATEGRKHLMLAEAMGFTE